MRTRCNWRHLRRVLEARGYKKSDAFETAFHWLYRITKNDRPGSDVFDAS